MQAYHKAARDHLRLDDGTNTYEQLLLTTKKLGDQVKADFLQIALKFVAYQKDQNSSETSDSSDIINVVNVNSSGKNGRYTRIKTKLEWSTTICQYQHEIEVADVMPLGKRNSIIK